MVVLDYKYLYRDWVFLIDPVVLFFAVLGSVLDFVGTDIVGAGTCWSWDVDITVDRGDWHCVLFYLLGDRHTGCLVFCFGRVPPGLG